MSTPRSASDPAGEHRTRAAGADVADAVAEVVGALRREIGAADPRCRWASGSPACSTATACSASRPNLPGAAGADIGRAGCAAARSTAGHGGERRQLCGDGRASAGRGPRRATTRSMVTLGTGIGGGLIVEGRVLAGAHGFAGEIGHMVVDPSGPPCPCGRRGCWERYASGGGLGAPGPRGRRGRAARRGRGAGRWRPRAGARRARDRRPPSTGTPRRSAVHRRARLVGGARAGQPRRRARSGAHRGRRRTWPRPGTLLLGPTRRAFAELVEGAGRPGGRDRAAPPSASGPARSGRPCRHATVLW